MSFDPEVAPPRSPLAYLGAHDFRDDRDPNETFHRIIVAIVVGSVLVGLVIVGLICLAAGAHARDDGRYAGSELKPWFDSLMDKTGGGCCADADGAVVKDVDWSVRGEGQECRHTPALSFSKPGEYEGHYCVRYKKSWWLVPDDAVVDGPNRLGPAIIWPICSSTRHVSGADTCKDELSDLMFIRCFIAGSMG